MRCCDDAALADGCGELCVLPNSGHGAYRIRRIVNMSIEHSVLLLSLPTAKHLRSPSFLSEAIAGAVAQTQKSLSVIVFSPLFSLDTNQKESIANAPVHFWKTVQDFLTFVYVEAAREAQSTDNILLSVDVILLDSGPTSLSGGALKRYEPEKWEAVFALDSGLGMSYQAIHGRVCPPT